MADTDPVLHYSPLCQYVFHNGATLELQIYRTDDSPWVLEVVNEQGTSIVWDDQFDTDRAAFDEFTRTLETEGLAAFADE
ncbi:MAG: hypothetical protein WBD34_14800 [Burkholderiaceae bacterium]